MHSKLPLYAKIYHSSLIPMVWLIIFAVTAAYNRYIFFDDSFLPGGLKAIKYIISLIFYFSTIMTIICHTLTILTDPGSLDYDIVSQLRENEKTNCTKCQKSRPLRAHHCSICDKCFMKMDHHCPWIFNCVGFGNQKFFFLFICYTIISAIVSSAMFIAYLCSESFKELYRNRKTRRLDFAQNNMRIFGDSFVKWGNILMIIFSLILSVFTLLSLGTLFFSQIFLISRNITNIENDGFQGKENENGFYVQNNKWFMVKVLLGLNEKWKWFFPIFGPNKYNGGYIYDIPKIND